MIKEEKEKLTTNKLEKKKAKLYAKVSEHSVCSETLAYKIQTPGNYPKESKQHSEHGESLK